MPVEWGRCRGWSPSRSRSDPGRVAGRVPPSRGDQLGGALFPRSAGRGERVRVAPRRAVRGHPFHSGPHQGTPWVPKPTTTTPAAARPTPSTFTPKSALIIYLVWGGESGSGAAEFGCPSSGGDVVGGCRLGVGPARAGSPAGRRRLAGISWAARFSPRSAGRGERVRVAPRRAVRGRPFHSGPHQGTPHVPKPTTTAPATACPTPPAPAPRSYSAERSDVRQGQGRQSSDARRAGRRRGWPPPRGRSDPGRVAAPPPRSAGPPPRAESPRRNTTGPPEEAQIRPVPPHAAGGGAQAPPAAIG